MNQSVEDTEKVDLSVALALFLLFMKLLQFPFYWMFTENAYLLLLLIQILDSTKRVVEHSLASTGPIRET